MTGAPRLAPIEATMPRDPAPRAKTLRHVRDLADIRVRIPMAPGFRSLNIAVSTGIAVAEALRQTGSFPA